MDDLTDLMHQDEIREVVGATYAALDRGGGRGVAALHYADADLADVPDLAVDWALGVGDPVRHADIRDGDVVLDLGCGGGIDVVLAARRVGPTGRVVGLDLLPAMCERTTRAADIAGVGDRCTVHRGQMEAIPLPDHAVDVVVSNGSLNLSPRKSRVLAEIARVLRPGGRLCAVDLVVDTDLPPEVLGSTAIWAGCLAGALSEPLLVKRLDRAGLVDVAVEDRRPFGLEHLATYPLFPPEVLDLLRRALPARAHGQVATAVLIRATRPAELATAATPRAVPAARTGHLDDITPDAVEAPGVAVRHLKRVDDVELKVLDVEAGGSTPYHTHRHAHEGLVLEGRGRLRLPGGDRPLRPGSTFSVAPTARHALAADADAQLRFVCMDCFID